MRRHTLLGIVSFLVIVVFTPRARSDAPRDDLARRLDAVILRSQLGQFWGAVLVAQDGQALLSKGYGFANESLVPIDSQTLFDIGSIAKQFTASLVIKLHAQGRLHLDDPITTHFPGLPSSAEGITLRHLLTHTSGLSDMNGAIQPLDFADRDEAVRLAFKTRPKSAPGERFEYCNGGYCIAAAIIERAAGGPFQALMREEIFKPAGLVNTGFLDGDGLDLSNATARIVSGRGGEIRRSILQDGWGWGLRGCGGILTSLEDLLRWDSALRDETLFDTVSKQAMLSPSLENYALGWFVEPAASGGTKMWHSGGTRGYRAFLLRIPERAIVIAVMTNERHDPITLGNRLLEELLPDERSGIDASLNINGLTLNQYKAAVIESGVQAEVRPLQVEAGVSAKRIQLVVSVPSGSERINAVEISMAAGEARTTAAAIRSHLKSKPVDSGSAAGVSLTVATLPYTVIDGRISLPAEVTLTVMPRYLGTGEDGKPVTDERICLVVMDSQNGFWPVILKLDRDAATKMAAALEP